MKENPECAKCASENVAFNKERLIYICGNCGYEFPPENKIGGKEKEEYSKTFLRNRIIRVFISSTFRDMHEERNYLVQYVFPELRRLCEARGVTWGEVDLRWGVPDELAAEGKVLPVCLEEIKRCRPYFICLLGERYGWIPDAIPPEVIENEPWLNEHIHDKKSVTELEILHGVLRNPDMEQHAFFYFRDPAYINNVPKEKLADFISEDKKSADKLNELKDRIRASGFPVRENYPDPKILGELVKEDLIRVIDKLYPPDEKLNPLDREEMDHEAYAQSRAKVYIGRPEYFDRIDSHANANSEEPIVILGESGSGKSALLANWAGKYREEHTDVLMIQHFIGASPYSADWASMLRRIMGEFKRKLDIQQDIPENPDALRSAFPNWLYMAAAKGRVVLMLDALNQLEDKDGAQELLWLPPVMPANLRLIVSTLPGKPLEEIKNRGWKTMKVEPLNLEERKKLIAEFLGDYGRKLSPARIERIANAPQSANPLYLRVLLDELRIFGVHEQLEERIGYYLKAENPYELYMKVIARWENSYGGGGNLVGDMLTLLWAARRGLTESELLNALGKDGKPLPRAEWSPLFLAMADALVNRGGLLTFAHDFLRIAAQDSYIPTESHQHRAHILLADYFKHKPAGARRTDELPWQLAEAREWQRLYELLADREFFKDAWDRNQFEIKTYWAKIEAKSPLRKVEAYRSQIEHPEAEDDKDYLSMLSFLLSSTDNMEDALRICSALEEQYRKVGEMNNLLVTIGNKANILFELGELNKAMVMQKEAEQISRQLGDFPALAPALGNQALILAALGELNTAMILNEEIKQIYQSLNDLNGVQRTLGNQANILYECGKLDKAMALYKEQERICQQLGNLHGLQCALGNQAVILCEHLKWDDAMDLHKEQERICRQLGNLVDLAISIGNQALNLTGRGEFESALPIHKEEERIYRDLRKIDGIARSLANQALLFLKQQGRAHEGLPLAEEAHRLATAHGYTALAKQIEPILNAVRRAAQGN